MLDEEKTDALNEEEEKEEPDEEAESEEASEEKDAPEEAQVEEPEEEEVHYENAVNKGDFIKVEMTGSSVETGEIFETTSEDPMLAAPVGISFAWKEKEAYYLVLEQLARRFLDGSAEVDPKKKYKSCDYCPLPGLCRIGESLTDATITEEENE